MKTMIEMTIHELCIAQEKLVDIHSMIYEEIHPRINQALAGLDDMLVSQQIDMDDETHQQYLLACKRAHKLEESIQLKCWPFLLQDEEKEEKSSTNSSEDDFIPILSKATKALKQQAIHEACTLEHYSSYVQWVYTAQTTDTRIIDTSEIYPRIHFLAGSQPKEVAQAFTYGFCGSITSSLGNKEILHLNKSLTEAVKKFRKSSKANLIVLKIISCGQELRPLIAPGLFFVQLCTANKANIRFGKMKSLSIPEVTPEWVCYRRALGFSVLIKKLQQLRESERGYMYNAPAHMFIYADGNCMLRFDAINKISSGISLISSCRVTGINAMHMQLCKLLREVKDNQCCICPTRFR